MPKAKTRDQSIATRKLWDLDIRAVQLRSTLKACPWCGPQTEPEETPEIVRTNGQVWWVRCQKCGTDHGTEAACRTPQEAHDAYNRRAPITVTVQP